MAHHRHHHHHHSKYYSPHRPNPKRTLVKVLKWVCIALISGVMYLLLFNPRLPTWLMQAFSPIIYISELIILIFGLFALNGFGLGSSDLGVWGFGALGVFLLFLGGMFYFGSGFMPYAYHTYEAAFGIVLVILGLFSLFRAKRRYGQFVYVR